MVVIFYLDMWGDLSIFANKFNKVKREICIDMMIE